MKKLLILIILICIFNEVNAQWKGIARNDSIEWYSDVQFLNKDTGYLISPIGYLPTNSAHSRLYRTKDGGNNWEFIDSFYDETYFHFFDYNNVIIQGRYNFNVGTPKVYGRWGMWHSKDAGRTLDSIPGTMFLGPPQFISPNIGFANNGGYTTFPLKISSSSNLYKTKDGGFHWYKVYDGAIQARTMHFPSDTLTGYIQYFNNDNFDSIIVIKTTDGGEHWNKIYTRAYNWYPSGTDVSEKFIFITKDIILHSWDSASFMSHDGGKSWKPTYFPRPYGLNNFVFTDTSTVYGSTNGYLAKDSTGTGFYWGLSAFSDSIITPEIQFVGKNFAYAFTPDKNASLIYTLQNPQKWNGVITAVKESIFHNEALELFPNPAQNSITFKGYGFKPGKVMLYGHDMLGRTVLNSVMQAATDGTIQSEMNISNWHQGIYQIEVWQGNLKQEIKLIKR